MGDPELLGGRGWVPGSPGGTCCQPWGVKSPNGGRPQTYVQSEAPRWGPGTTDRFWRICDTPPHQKIVQSCVCVHVFLVGQGWSVALIRFLESSVSQRLGTPGWGCTFSRGQCGQGRARRDVSIPQSLLASGSLI